MFSNLLQGKNFGIFLLLIIASFLRLYGLFDLQYTYDELSVLDRLKFNSVFEVIEKGVKPDGHPALVQVFLYYYTLVFGIEAWVVKLPFILCGIASVYLVYTIGKRWFNATSGLIAATIVCCTQYFVYYSTIARPYASGLFLSLLVLKFWLELLFNEKAQFKHYLGFSIFAVLAAIDHQFSLLFAGLCGLLGLFFLNRSTAKKYVMACLGAVVLYSPHFPIFFNQLGIGGIGVASGDWLSAPRYDFIVNFIRYLFHYSYLFLFAFIGLIVFIYFKQPMPISKTQTKVRLVLCLLFILSFAIGFFYSRWVNPVLQFSGLIFALPCLLLFLSSFASDIKGVWKWSALLLLIGIGLSTLIFNRKYYDLLYTQSFDTYFKTMDKTIREQGNENVHSILKGDVWMLDFYKQKSKSSATFDIIGTTTNNYAQCQAIYDTLKTKFLIVADFGPNELLQAALYYPYVYKKIAAYNFEVYVLSKSVTNEKLMDELEVTYTTDFKSIPEQISVTSSFIKTMNNSSIFSVDSLTEFPPFSLRIKTQDLNCKEGQFIVAKIEYIAQDSVKAILCASIDENKKNVYWAGSELTAFYNTKTKTQTAFLSTYVSEDFNDAKRELLICLWNNRKANFVVKDFSVYKWDLNPYRYGLLLDF